MGLCVIVQDIKYQPVMQQSPSLSLSISLLSYRICEFLILSLVMSALMVRWPVYLWVLFTLCNSGNDLFRW